MSQWEDYAQEGKALEWPYPVRYGEERRVHTDVLVLGGGIAGCWAAISAAREGAKVAIVEKGATIRSGSGGSGCDHWLNTPNPCSPITAEEIVEKEVVSNGGYANGISRYIAARESYETLLELEEMGGKIRDTEDEFKGADFRDEETKFLFAYDYENKYMFRVWGTTFKVALYNECKRLGVEIHDRVMATSLLTEEGKQEARVIGATGLHGRTGEFIIFSAGATVNCLSRHQRNWVLSTELIGNATFRPGTIVGDGHAMAWRAGAEFTQMEKTGGHGAGTGYGYPFYGTGNPFCTWVPCTMVDADGKEIPWVDREGRPLKSVSERTRPAPGQKFLGERERGFQWVAPRLPLDLGERIRKGELKLPLYADLPSMTDHERRAIWGLMVGEEAKTRIPLIETYTESGFDPAKDLLQSYIMLRGDPLGDAFVGMVNPQERAGGEGGDAGGLLTDWDLKTTLEGFYCAGDALFAANYHYHAAATGRYAGRKAAAYAGRSAETEISRDQVEREKRRVYAPAGEKDGIEWKELNAGICRVMQNYCGEPKSDELLRIALIWLKELEDEAVPKTYATNPHKLMRTLEVFDILTCSQMIVHASLARKASSTHLGFVRSDYPDLDPPDWHKWITIRLQDDEVQTRELPIDFWGDLKGNYEKHYKA